MKKLGPGDIAVIDHTNIDRIAAEELISTGVRAVLNASQSSNGRYPNAGPLLLAQAGVRLIDAPGADLFDRIKNGDPLTIEDGTVMPRWQGGVERARARRRGARRAARPPARGDL